MAGGGSGTILHHHLAIATTELLEVGGGQPLGTVVEGELDPLTMFKGLETLHIDGAMVDEDFTLILVIHQDEAEAFVIVEPFHYASCHI